MALWKEQVVPRVTDLLLGAGPVHRLRTRVCAGLEGEVVEIGFGSGLNLQHYPSAVTKVHAVEPSDVAWQLANRKQTGNGRPTAVRAGLDAEDIQLADASVDAVVSVFTLCTVPHVDAALSEVRRVLKPGGSFHFLEHGLAPERRVAAWQRRLTPIQRRVAAGCHLDRSVEEAVEASGLATEELEAFYLAGGPPGLKVLTYLYLGRAVRR